MDSYNSLGALPQNFDFDSLAYIDDDLDPNVINLLIKKNK